MSTRHIKIGGQVQILGLQGRPIEVVQASDRLALTALANGVIVQEVGGQFAVKVTVNHSDIGGNTKTSTQSDIFIPPQSAIPVGSVITYSNGSSDIAIAAAIASFFNALPFFDASSVGNVATVKSHNKQVRVGPSILFDGSHAGFLTLEDTDNGAVESGNYYQVTDNTKLNIEDGWTLVTSGMNADVADGAIIQPNQAYVNNALTFINQFDMQAGFVSNDPPVTSFDAVYFDQRAVNLGTSGSLSLIGLNNQALDSTTVDTLLGRLSGDNPVTFGSSVDISGGTNAIPSGISSLVPGVWTITVTGLPEVGDAFVLQTGNFDYAYVSFASDPDSLSPTEVLVSDSPSNDVLVGRIFDVLSTQFGGGIASKEVVDNVVTVTTGSFEWLVPTVVCDYSGSGLTINTNQGSKTVYPDSINTMVSNGWTVTFNGPNGVMTLP